MTTNTNAALRNALIEAQAGLEFAAARLPQTTDFVPSHIAALKIVNAALTTAAAVPAAHDCCNSWFASLPEGRQAVLRDDKWTLAHAAFDAGRAAAAPQPAVQQGDELPREDFAWLVVQEACETEPAYEDDPECIRILRIDLKSAVLAAFLRLDAARAQAKEGQSYE